MKQSLITLLTGFFLTIFVCFATAETPQDYDQCLDTSITNCSVPKGPLSQCTGTYIQRGTSVNFTISVFDLLPNQNELMSLHKAPFWDNENWVCQYADAFLLPAFGDVT